MEIRIEKITSERLFNSQSGIKIGEVESKNPRICLLCLFIYSNNAPTTYSRLIDTIYIEN